MKLATHTAFKSKTEKILKKIKTSATQYPISKILLDTAKYSLKFYGNKDDASSTASLSFVVPDSEEIRKHIVELLPPPQ